MPEAVSKEGKAYKYDISVPLSSFQEVVDATREQLQRKGLLHENAVKHVLGYGHVGDGELRANYCKPMLTVLIRRQVTYISTSWQRRILRRSKLLWSLLSMSLLVGDTSGQHSLRLVS